jgi:signal transduction histidine kinase
LGRFGLIGIEERVRILGGQVQVESPPEGGTSVSVQLPTGQVKAIDLEPPTPASR